MPYYRVANIAARVPTLNGTVSSGGVTTISNQCDFPTVFHKELGFRTKPPAGSIVSVVPAATADPYSYLTGLNAVKAKAAKARGFDATLFREDRGHPWDLEKYEVTGKPLDFVIRYSDNSRAFVKGYALGALVPNSPIGFNIPSARDLVSWGAVMYGQASPTSDRYSLPSFVGELERLPSFLPSFYKSRGTFYKNLGSDYLNAQFGWLPFLGGLREIATALAAASRGLFRPWGAYHRSRTDPTIRTQSERTYSGTLSVNIGDRLAPSEISNMISGSSALINGWLTANTTATSDVTINRWYEGEYVYLPDPKYDNDVYMQKFDTLMKTDITPADLWELAPWSWLVDWFLKIGKAIESYETATTNRILSTYAYAMEETVSSTRVLSYGYSLPFGFTYASAPQEANIVEYKYTRKRRIRANPFGFTPNPEVSLNAMQLGILGALGLTKVRR